MTDVMMHKTMSIDFEEDIDLIYRKFQWNHEDQAFFFYCKAIKLDEYLKDLITELFFRIMIESYDW